MIRRVVALRSRGAARAKGRRELEPLATHFRDVG